MDTPSKTVEVLNDLIEINNDRIKGFEKAAESLDDADADLKAFFSTLAGESRDNVAELHALAGPEAEHASSTLGSLHRAWIDIKATFSGNDRQRILDECTRGENAIRDAYESALDEGNHLTAEAATVLARQKRTVDLGRDRIKALCRGRA